MSNSEFRIGQKVVCVDASNRAGFRPWRGDAPVEGAIYTVRGIVIEEDAEPYVSLILAEIARKCRRAGYRADRFRPLVTDDSRYSIAQFQQMCVDASKGKSRVRTVDGVCS